MVRKKRIKEKYIEGKGILNIINVPDMETLDRNKDLEYYNDIFYQCGKCGTCRTAYQENGWPRVCPSGEYGKFEAYYLGGKNLLTWAKNTDKLKWTPNLTRIFYHCTLCLACINQCQIPEIHNYAGEWLMGMREEAVKQGLGPMPEQDIYTANVLRENNPYMEKHDDRLNWLPKNIDLNQLKEYTKAILKNKRVFELLEKEAEIK